MDYRRLSMDYQWKIEQTGNGIAATQRDKVCGLRARVTQKLDI
jgi:hypothetical protein